LDRYANVLVVEILAAKFSNLIEASSVYWAQDPNFAAAHDQIWIRPRFWTYLKG
jgi:hypothetical protein